MSKVVLNIHADGLPAIEPRIHLAAACGCMVLSERVDGDLSPFEERVLEYEGPLSRDLIHRAIELYRTSSWDGSSIVEQLSAKRFILDCVEERSVHAG